MENRWSIYGGRREEDGKKKGGGWMGNEWGKGLDWEGVLSFFPVFFG